MTLMNAPTNSITAETWTREMPFLPNVSMSVSDSRNTPAISSVMTRRLTIVIREGRARLTLYPDVDGTNYIRKHNKKMSQ